MVVAGLPTFATKEPAAPSIDALQHGPIHSLWPLASPIPSMPLEHHVPLPAWDDEMPEAYAWLRERLEGAVACTEFEFHLPWIDAIRRLKVQRGAMVLAHNYQHPLVFHGVADVTGDSLALARAGREAAAEVLVLCGVGFMGETAKLLSPGKTILMPAPEAGCSLASSITADDVRLLRKRYPGIPVVSYVNTSASVKAESDICCTSGNAVQVIESLRVPRVLFLPDRHLAAEVSKATDVELIAWNGACEVHEAFSAADLRRWKLDDPQLTVIAHPECPADVCAEADFVGSTSALAGWLGRHRPARVALVTECSMADNLRAEFPTIEFVGACQLCPHMRLVDLPRVYAALRDMAPRVEVDPTIAARARVALERMLAV
jgi:quinolinate synthase